MSNYLSLVCTLYKSPLCVEETEEEKQNQVKKKKAIQLLINKRWDYLVESLI